MADHPLRPATDRRLGKPLPHQLANPTSAAPRARGPCRSPAFLRREYAVLAPLSRRYPPLRGTFRCIPHPFAARRQDCSRAAARLACVKHAASVQSEPGSNSSVRSCASKLILTLALPPSASARRQDVRPRTIAGPKPKLRRVSTSCLGTPTESRLTATPHGPPPRAPTPIGCRLLKSRPIIRRVMRASRDRPAERRDYTTKTGEVNSPLHRRR